jgi:hypothetical protein
VHRVPLTISGAAALALTAVLVAPAPAYADVAHDPTVSCGVLTWRQNGVLVYAGYARVPDGHATHVVGLSIRCVYRNAQGEHVAETSAPAPVVATSGSNLLAAGALTICASAVARYDDGHVGTVPETCVPQ